MPELDVGELKEQVSKLQQEVEQALRTVHHGRLLRTGIQVGLFMFVIGIILHLLSCNILVVEYLRFLLL